MTRLATGLLLSLPRPGLGFQMPTPAPSFYIDNGDPNSGSHAYVAGPDSRLGENRFVNDTVSF